MSCYYLFFSFIFSIFAHKLDIKQEYKPFKTQLIRNRKKIVIKQTNGNRSPYAESVLDTGICKIVKHLFINLGEQLPILST